MGELLENVLWGWHVLIMILVVGIQYTISSGFYQIRRVGYWLKTACTGGSSGGKGGTTQFQALTAALAGSIGTGNIVGVASAITVGGPGALFWMWISALLGMMTIFGENVLSRIYQSAPGALGYIRSVKKIGKPLACIYAVGCLLASLGMGNMIQTNAAAAAFSEFGVPVTVSAAIIAIALFFVARGGLSFAVKITEKLVPLMTLLFFSASVAVLWIYRRNLPGAFSSILNEAFSLKAGAGGAAGMLIAAKTGISRGIFTNEAGLGSSSFAYEDVQDRSPVQIGCMGIFQVFIDTIVMCTVTGLCILCCNPSASLDGAQLTFYAYESALGVLGGKAVSLCTALFAFATTVTWCCYGRSGLFYLTNGRGKNFFALLFAAAAFIGCTLRLEQVFQLGDAFNGLMAIPNILALLYFSDTVQKACREPHAVFCTIRRERQRRAQHD